MRMVFTFEPTTTGSRFTSVTHFPNLEAMQQLVEMGMEEGLRSAMGQLDAVLADLASLAADRGTGTQLLGDTQVRVSRLIRGTPEQVWRAHHDPDLLKRRLYMIEIERIAGRRRMIVRVAQQGRDAAAGAVVDCAGTAFADYITEQFYLLENTAPLDLLGDA